MNVFGWVLLGAAALTTVGAAVAQRHAHRPTEQLARPAFVLILLALAWLVHAEATGAGRFLLAGLGLALVGEVVLLERRPSETRTLVGLVVGAAARLTILGAVLTLPDGRASGIGVAVTVVAAVAALWWVRRAGAAATGTTATTWAATAYGVVLALATALAWSRGLTLVGLGLLLFAASGVLLARLRMSRSPVGRASELGVLVTSQAAQLLVVLGVLRPDLGR